MSPDGNVEGRPGDIFFGMDARGPMVKYRDENGWHDVPLRETRGPEAPARLEVARGLGSEYEFRWNGALLAEASISRLVPLRVMLFAAEGVRAEFSRFSVTVPASSGGSAR